MKLLYDHQIFEGQRFGGVSRYFHELIRRAVADPAFEVSLWMGAYVNEYGTERWASRFANFGGRHRPDLPKLGRLLRPLSRFAFERLARRVRPDVYHPTYYDPYLSDASDGGPRRVITVYDMIHELFPESFHPRDRTTELKRAAVLRADRIIAISESTKRDLVRLFGTSPDKISVTPLASSLARADAPANLEFPYLLYVGPRGGYKNFAALLEAWATSVFARDVHLVCFGGGEWTSAEWERIVGLDATERIHLRQGGDEALSRLYLGARAFVYPSLYEGFGIPPLEAMSHDCPVIAARSSSIPEVAGDAAEYFDPRSIEELRARIESTLTDESLRSESIRLGRARVAGFSWDRTYVETVRVYEEVSKF